MSPQTERDTAKQIVRTIFKNDDGQPFQLTDGQADIFNIIWLKRHQRNQIMTTTQYGKSETVAMAVLLRAVTFAESWVVLAPDSGKTKIIMNKAIGHIFDSPIIESQIDLLSLDQIERLKHERSRNRVTFIGGGEIRTLTADSRNSKRVKEALTGQGARNIVEDEASLIGDELQAMVLRMLGGFQDSFLVKIGNPFLRNHFLRTWHQENYNKLFVDYKQAMREGRLSEAFIEEMRSQPFFRELYEVEFPDQDLIQVDGYRRLITDEQLEAAFVKPGEIEPQGRPMLGADFAGGGNDRSAYVIRYDNLMKLVSTNQIADTMQQVPILRDLMDEYGVLPEETFIDYGGLGQGIGDRLHELEIYTNNIMFGESAIEKQTYKNKRAEMYYHLQKWIIEGGKIEYDDAWYELLSINYKTDSERKFQIQPKQDLKKLLRANNISASSPDVADGACLTFGSDSMITEDDFDFV